MRETLFWVLMALGALLAVPVAVLFVECLAALWPRRSRPGPTPPRRRGGLAVLMPAHNEEGGIAEAIASVRAQLAEGDRLIVIADNCTDGTARRARGSGATVVERFDADRRGKGFALAFGLEHLDADPPEVVVVADADTTMAPGSMDALYRTVQATGRPAQAIYLFDPPPNGGLKDRLSAFALIVKNLVRPLGLERLGGPCLLQGSGGAMPWDIVDVMKGVGGNLTDDTQMAVQAGLAGKPPVLCREARVIGRLPAAERAARVQRTRWEHGHLVVILKQTPRLLWNALRRRRLSLLLLALEVSVPPLALLCLLWSGLALAAGAGALAGASPVPAGVAAAEGLMLAIAVAAAWGRHARHQVPLRVLLSAPLYVLWKIPLYAAFVFRRQKTWVRTPRDAEFGAGGSAHAPPPAERTR